MKNKKLFIISVSFNILFFIMASAFIINKGGVSYVMSKVSGQQSETFSVHHLVHESVFDIYPAKQSATFFVGDSLTDFANWNEILEDDNVKTRGIPGDKTSDLIDNIDVLLEDKPARILLMIGINDLSNGVSVTDAVVNYKKIVAQIKSESPETELVIQSALPINMDMIKQTQADNDMIVAYNSELEKIAESNGLEYVDLHSHFLKDGQLDASLTVDGLHINGDGYLIWKEVIQPLVK